MPFHIHCIDDPAKPGLRARLRVAHLRYMIAHRDVILFGGPLRRPDGTTIGSSYALSYKTRPEVDAFLAKEPYSQGALFSSLSVLELAVMVPERHPGFLEEELAREIARVEGNADEAPKTGAETLAER